MTLHLRTLLPLLPGLLALAVSHASANESAEPLYVNGTLAYGVSVSGGDTRIDFGNGVSAAVPTSLGGAVGGSLAVGKEFLSRSDTREPRHYRLEVEGWLGSVKRDEVTLGTETRSVGDTLKAQALFVNGLYRVYQGEQYRSWAGFGLGWGRVSVPEVPDAVPGCECLNKKTLSGLAYRLKLQVQRDLSDTSGLYAELGYVRLPDGSTGGVPSTYYGPLGITTVGIGYEKRF